MTLLTKVLIAVIAFFVTFIGGMLTMYGMVHGLPPKTAVYNSDQKTTVRTTQVQEQSSYQITVVTGKSNFYLNVNGKTNSFITSKTNHESRTNNQPDKPLIPHFSLPIP